MLKIITTLTLILVGLLAKGQEVENRKVSEFSKVIVENGVELIFTESDQFALKIETKNNAMLKNVVTEVKGKTLKMYFNSKDNSNQSKNLVKIYLSAKNLDSFNANDNAKITVINQISTTNCTINLNSGSAFNGTIKNEGKTKLIGDSETVFNGKIETESFMGYFKNNAKINISGITKKARILTNDIALCNAKNLIANSISITAEGNSTVLVHTDSKIAVTVADKAKVTYTGVPYKIQLSEDAEAIYKFKNNQLLSLNY